MTVNNSYGNNKSCNHLTYLVTFVAARLTTGLFISVFFAINTDVLLQEVIKITITAALWLFFPEIWLNGVEMYSILKR